MLSVIGDKMNTRTIKYTIGALTIMTAGLISNYVNHNYLEPRRELKETIEQMDERACFLSDSAYEKIYLIPRQAAKIAGWGEVQVLYAETVKRTLHQYDSKYWKLREQYQSNDKELQQLKIRKHELENKVRDFWKI